MSDSSSREGKRSQKDLANVVKNVHKRLRTKYKSRNEDLEKIWKDHCDNKILLKGYAEAMHELAVEHWNKHPRTRIDWCIGAIKEYFFLGQLHKILVKEEKRKYFNAKRDLEAEKSNGVSSWDNSTEKPSEASVEEPTFEPVFKKEDRYTEIQLPFEGKVRLLDVGSCFNPFGDQGNFLSVGIDISPATKKVHTCDFLALKISDTLGMDTEHPETYLNQLQSPVECLPKNSFHVVVFSLLLEYLPSTKQRWKCCTKAFDLLLKNGLLLIITPDSHQQHRNARMIKSWKTAIESIGFIRCRYVKEEHLHCMAFRKACTLAGDDVDIDGKASEMLYIPQDTNNEDLTEDSLTDELPHKSEGKIISGL